MSNPVPETEPDPDEVLLHEPAEPRSEPVPVTIEGPLRAQLPPAPRWAAFSVPCTISTPVLVLSKNPRRKRAYLVSNGGATWLGQTQSRVNPDGFRLPDSVDGIALEITHGDDVWAQSEGATSTLRVSDEYWSD